MAELPAELIHAILINITDHISMINLALTSRLCYTTAMPVILAEESRYIREVMLPGKHLSIYEYPDSRARLPPDRLDSPAGPFTGTFRKISFTPWHDPKYMCCIRRIVRRVKTLERISMDVPEDSLRSWITAYMNICIERPGIEFVLNGGEGYISIAVDDDPPLDQRLGAKTMSRPSLPFGHPLRVTPVHAHPAFGSATMKRHGLSHKFQQQLKLTGGHNIDTPQNDSYDHRLIPPQIRALKLVNEFLFSSHIAAAVQALAAGKHITSFTLINDHQQYHDSRRFQTLYGTHSRYYHHVHSRLQQDTTTHRDLGSVLASLNFPNLTHLSLGRITPPSRALMQFLARHPLISDLRLDVPPPPVPDGNIAQSVLSTIATIAGGSIPAMPPPRLLPNLKRVSGTAHWVVRFVRWRQLKKRGGRGNARHLPVLEELELLTGTGIGIGTTTWTPPNLLPWEAAELNAVYEALFYATGASSSSSSVLPWKSSSSESSKPSESSSKHSSAANTGTTIRIRSLILETLSCSHFVDWLMLEAAKWKSWPVLSDNTGVGIETLTISQPQTFTVPVKTRVALLETLGRWCPALAREIETDEHARVRSRQVGADGNSDTGADDVDTPSNAADKDDFTQRLLKRIIWHTFPSLQTLWIGVEKRDQPHARRISRPAGL